MDEADKEELLRIADALDDAAWSAEFNSKWLSNKADEIRALVERY